jgi:hypothetical protein
MNRAARLLQKYRPKAAISPLPKDRTVVYFYLRAAKRDDAEIPRGTGSKDAIGGQSIIAIDRNVLGATSAQHHLHARCGGRTPEHPEEET